MHEFLGDLDAFVARFSSCSLTRPEWTHSAHLAVGAWHVDRYGSVDALVRLRREISRLNESFGNRNTATDGYHETITAAYVRLIEKFLAACPSEMSLQQKVAALIEGPWGEKNALLRFYTNTALMSARARAEWVEPDLGPIAV